MSTKKPLRSNKNLYSEMVRYTPALASEILARNDLNRYRSFPKVVMYAEIMSRGEWDSDNGAAILFAKSGALVDGQHRLAAVESSKKTVSLYTTFNVSDKAFTTIDCGKPRRGADICSILQVKNYAMMAAVLTLCYREELGLLWSTYSPQNSQYEELLERHPRAAESVQFVSELRSSHKCRGIYAASPAAYFHYAFSRKDKGLADACITRLLTGLDLKRSDPFYVLRELCVSDSMSASKVTRVRRMALTIKAWNVARVGKSIKSLRWLPKENFPEVE